MFKIFFAFFDATLRISTRSSLQTKEKKNKNEIERHLSDFFQSLQSTRICYEWKKVLNVKKKGNFWSNNIFSNSFSGSFSDFIWDMRFTKDLKVKMHLIIIGNFPFIQIDFHIPFISFKRKKNNSIKNQNFWTSIKYELCPINTVNTCFEVLFSVSIEEKESTIEYWYFFAFSKLSPLELCVTILNQYRSVL